MMETAAASHTSRLGNCEVCASQPARYACPKCEVKTCCLACVQIHKRELQCDGKRDRTKFMPISEMTEREFMSDYCFLEECTRYAEHRKKDPSKRYTQQQRQLPLPLHRLRVAAKERGTRLQFLLANFSRHKENSTYLNWKERCIYWQIEWLFVHIDSETPTRFVEKRCNEQQTLEQLLHKYLDVQQELGGKQRKVLQHHQTAGIGELSLWLRAEGVKRSGQRCYRLAAYQTLRSNLAGKTIVEYPAIYISYEQRPPAGFDLIDSDEEVEAAASEPQPTPAKRPKPEAAAKPTKQLPELQDIYELAASFGVDNSSESSSDAELLSDNENADN
ncbi:box C/D snoRNA protein 1 [Drosophila hydei]|uniref:Box C/D snoRNA protein 1 n=1 Tax=Drosophila hydei TaxID=7224 RepID=A0A6J1LAC9_DROHY|nr:box C/D snoRNA protein 1 [Drosophila hydei]